MLRIRALEAHDVDAIKEIDRSSFRSDEQYPDELYDSVLTGGTLRAVVAENDGVIAGYALLDVHAQPVRIRSMAVLPAYRNKGCGSALLLHLMEEFDTLELLVEKNNLDATRLYERLGFAFVERDEKSELAGSHHMFRRFKNASCLKEPPSPKRAATTRADGTT